jgi:hypothetical protein
MEDNSLKWIIGISIIVLLGLLVYGVVRKKAVVIQKLEDGSILIKEV